MRVSAPLGAVPIGLPANREHAPTTKTTPRPLRLRAFASIPSQPPDSQRSAIGIPPLKTLRAPLRLRAFASILPNYPIAPLPRIFSSAPRPAFSAG